MKNKKQSLIDYLINNSNNKNLDYSLFDVNATNKAFYNSNAIMYVFCYNKAYNINVTNEQLNYLIKNSNLHYADTNDCTAVMHAFENNMTQNLNLDVIQIDYLIKNTIISHYDKYDRNLFIYYLYNNEREKINFTIEQYDYLLKKQNFSKNISLLETVLVILSNVTSNKFNDKDFLDFWHCSNDKLFLLSYIEQHNHCGRFNKLLQIPELKIFKEVTLLEKSLLKGKVNKNEQVLKI